VALGYNICFGVIGGSTPLAAAWLVERTGNEIAPAFLIMAAAAIAFFAILRFRETYRSPFAGGTSSVAEPVTARSASTPAA
jgi:MFS transporter, MHS family, proline/betaine transporter